MEHPAGESDGGSLRVDFDRRTSKMKLSSSTLSIFFWCAAVFLGLLQAWSSRITVAYLDIIPFVDMANYILKGEWSMVINGTSNPLFAGLLALTMAAFKPSVYWQYPTVHLLLFFIFLFSLWSFDFFLRQMILLHRQQNSAEQLHVPEWILMTIGYTLFLWSSLTLIRVSLTDPDMLVAAFFYLAAGLLLRIRQRKAGWSTYLALGLVLGLGYLTKSIMFPVSLLCLGAAMLMGARSPRGVVYALGATLVFVAVSAPFIVALSLKFGKPTFGESGKFNALLDIDHVPTTFLWKGYDGPYGTLLHPVHQIFDRPATFEFASPVGGSYPLRYDFTYWIEGLTPHYLPEEMAKNLVANFRSSARWWALGLNGSIFAGLFVLFWVSGRRRLILNDVAAFWFLLIPSFVTLTMYGILHFEPRYIGGFLAVTFTCLFFSVQLPPTLEARRLFSGVAVLLLLMFVSPIGIDIPISVTNISSLLDFLKPLGAKRNPNAEVVKGLQAMGLRPGDGIASLELSVNPETEGDDTGPAFWACLGQFRLVAEVFFVSEPHTPDLTPFRRELRDNNFWDADMERQEKVIDALAKTGARAVVSLQEPRGPGAAGWSKIGNTNYHLRWLQPVSTASHGG